ncbi:MAG: 4Fe-4S binding protein, partial [Deltaproteobacteria bacterium]|nr:4Fe-4S binding protein [Deltaproteobacteria bacterium]
AIAFSWGPGGVPRPLVDAGRCTSCGDCVPACPAGAIAAPGAGA